jgi:hypothetical protein
MPKWNKDAKEFAVNVHYSEDKGTQVRIPKPILEKMGKPKRVSFVVDGKNIRIRPELEEAVRDLIKHKKERKN